MCTSYAVIPTVGIAKLKSSIEFPLPSAAVINGMTLVLEGIQVILNSLTRIVMDDRFATDFLFACQGWLCNL